VTGHEGGQGGGASPGDLKLSGVTLGAKEKVGGDKVKNQELGAEPLHVPSSHSYRIAPAPKKAKVHGWTL
jgi:hypothetical protein